MPDRLSDADLAELERMHEEATPGPWSALYRGSDLKLVAALRNAAPALIAEVRDHRRLHADGWITVLVERDRLRARVEELEKELSESETTETMACAERDQAQSALAAARAEVERLHDARDYYASSDAGSTATLLAHDLADAERELAQVGSTLAETRELLDDAQQERDAARAEAERYRAALEWTDPDRDHALAELHREWCPDGPGCTGEDCELVQDLSKAIALGESRGREQGRREQIEACPTCNGDGLMYVAGTSSAGGYLVPDDEVAETCAECGGTGKGEIVQQLKEEARAQGRHEGMLEERARILERLRLEGFHAADCNTQKIAGLVDPCTCGLEDALAEGE